MATILRNINHSISNLRTNSNIIKTNISSSSISISINHSSSSSISKVNSNNTPLACSLKLHISPSQLPQNVDHIHNQSE